jgi:hypothetical protein
METLIDIEIAATLLKQEVCFLVQVSVKELEFTFLVFLFGLISQFIGRRRREHRRFKLQEAQHSAGANRQDTRGL